MALKWVDNVSQIALPLRKSLKKVLLIQISNLVFDNIHTFLLSGTDMRRTWALSCDSGGNLTSKTWLYSEQKSNSDSLR